MAEDVKVTTIRIPSTMAEELALIARTEKVSEQEFIRQALREYLRARRTDPEFNARLQERVAQDRVILDRLAKST